jgi:D-sedoheptulose 7-phosphate isomerase
MFIREHIEAHIKLANSMLDLTETIKQIGDVCLDAIQKGGKIILAGNGGSAADSQHIAAEFTGRFVRERESLPALALTTDTSALTAIANDYGYDKVFSRQLSGVGNKGDIFIGISTSGNSENIVKAIEVAKLKGIVTIGLLGKTGGKIKNLADYPIIVPSNVTARIQEMHILIGHLICEYVDREY